MNQDAPNALPESFKRITREVAAQRLGVSVRTLRERDGKGLWTVRRHKHGGHAVYYDYEDLHKVDPDAFPMVKPPELVLLERINQMDERIRALEAELHLERRAA